MKRKFLLLAVSLFIFVFTFGQQLNENFDGATFPPDDWTLQTGSGDWDQSNETADHTTGSDNFARYDCFHINGSTPAYLITPRLDVEYGDRMFTFWVNYYHKNGSFGNNAQLYIDVSDNNGVTWTNGTTNYISGQEGTGWFQVSIDLGNFEGQNFIGFAVTVRFKAISDYGSYNIAIDDVNGPAIYHNPCSAPSDQTATNITANGADLGWTDASGSNWDLYIVAVGGAAPNQFTTPTVNDTPDNPYTWTGGTPGTTYNWYVRSDCDHDNTGTSDWIGPSFFTANCPGVSTFSYTEDFSSWEPSCWYIDKRITGSTDEWQQYSSGGVDCAKADFDNQNNDNTSIMLTPTFDISGLTSPYFSFKWSHKYSAFFPNDSLSVEVSDDNGTTWHQVWAKKGSDLNSNDGAGDTSPGSFVQAANFDLSSYGDNVVIRFYAFSGHGPDLFIDDFVVKDMPTCQNPTSQTVNNITPNGARLGWTDDSGSHWDIYIVPSGSPAPTQSTTPTVNDVSTNPYTWNGGNPATTYDWYVRSDCDQDNTGTSDWIGPNTFTTLNQVSSYPYYESFESDFGLWMQATDDDMDWIRHSGATPSSNTGPSSAASGSYYIYTHALGNINSKAILYLTFDFSSLTNPQFSFFYNMYGEDMGTLKIQASTNNGETWNTLWTKSGDQGDRWKKVIIYLDSYGGNSNVYLRIWGKTGDSYHSDMAIDTIDIREAPSCLVPTGQTESGITSSGANLSWTENGSATTWQIMIDTAKFDTTGYTNIITTTNNPHNVTGLNSNTDYDWYVRASCGGGSYSDWYGPSTFTTLCTPTDIPYFENFDDATGNSFPDCMTVENTNGVRYWWVVEPYGLSYPNAAMIAGSQFDDMDDWFFTRGLNLNGGTTYEVSFVYKAASDVFPEKLSVYWGTSAHSLAMCDIPIFNDNIVDNTNWLVGGATFTPADTGVYYVGFHGYSDVNSDYLYVDDIQITEYTSSATWTGNIDNDWTNPDNWTTTVPGASTDVIIPVGLTNYPTLDITGLVNSLTIESNSSGDGSLIMTGHLKARGDITVQRYVTKGEWHNIGVTVENQTLNTYYFNHNPDIWITKYNENDDSRTYLTDLTEPIEPGYGNEIWVDENYVADGISIDMTGPIVYYDVSPTLSFTDAAHGYNLIANPFPSAIDLDNITTLTNVDTQFWVWNPDASGGGTYADWNSSSGAGALTGGIIPMGQGFFVHANGANPSITIPESAAVHSSQAYYKNNDKEQVLITLNATGDDQLNILFIEGTTEGYDVYDTKKMFSMSNVTPQIFSKAGDINVSLNSLPELYNDDQRVIPVGFIPGTEGGIKTITAEISLPEDVEVILEDTKLNIFQDLKADNIYRFAATQDDETMRFLLHVGRNITGVDDETANTNLNVYGFNNNIYILSGSDMANKTKRVEVYDAMGRKIISKKLGRSKMDVIHIGNYDSYLIVRVITGNNVSTHKILFNR